MATDGPESRADQLTGPERNVALAHDGLMAWNRGEVERTLSTLTDDVEIVVPAEVGNPGSFHGIDGFLRWAGNWEEAWEEFSLEVLEIEPVGQRHVAASLRGLGRGRGSGIEVENRLGYVVGVRGEQAEFISLQPSFEDARALAAEREAAGTD